MTSHEQHSDHSKVWFDAEIVDNGDALAISGTSFWLRGTEHRLGPYDPDIGAGPFRLWIEKTDGGADYVLDLTGFGEPISFGVGIGAPLVAWRDREGEDVHVLRSVE